MQQIHNAYPPNMLNTMKYSIYSGNSTLCKLLPDSELVKNSEVVQEDMYCAVWDPQMGKKKCH